MLNSPRGDAVFEVGSEHPERFNGFKHDPEEAARVRVGLLRELAETGEALVATHPVIPVCLPCGGRRRHLSLGTSSLRVLAAKWVPSHRLTLLPTAQGRTDIGIHEVMLIRSSLSYRSAERRTGYEQNQDYN